MLLQICTDMLNLNEGPGLTELLFDQPERTCLNIQNIPLL